MTSPADRVAVPTNGHHPALTDDALEGRSVDASEDREEPSTTSSAPTAGQLIAGFGIVAALIVLILGRRRPSR